VAEQPRISNPTVTIPWLSVIVPTFNGADYLGAALESIVAERDSNIEVIAVDDGSTDATRQILANYTNRLALTILERRVGNWAENTNLGIERARGEWLCFLHQDDLWLPGRLAALRGQLTPEASLVLHAADFIDHRGRRVGRWRCPLPAGPRGSPPKQTVSRLLVQNFVPLPVALFRRTDAQRVGGLNSALWFTADWDFWLKLAAFGATVYVPDALAAFRVHEQSQTVRRSERSTEMREQYQSVFDAHWSIWSGRIDRPERVESAARLAREINVALAARHHGEPIAWKRFLSAMAVSPGKWAYCLQNSRIFERVMSRLRARLK
jgi:glycosyltransferase involved in cell wall biosynthesis